MDNQLIRGDAQGMAKQASGLMRADNVVWQVTESEHHLVQGLRSHLANLHVEELLRVEFEYQSGYRYSEPCGKFGCVSCLTPPNSLSRRHVFVLSIIGPV